MNNISFKKRKEMFDILTKQIDFSLLDNVLDVGVTADKQHPESNFFERFYPRKEHITALSNQDARWLETEYPGLKFISGNGLNLPFADDSFDLVFSSAVIEHVGSFENQCMFFHECCRVSKKYVFISTPNRFYPIEFHTVLPFIHWLPKTVHRKILKLTGENDLSLEENLNLLSKSEITRIINFEMTMGGGGSKIEVKYVRLFGWVSNFVVFVEK